MKEKGYFCVLINPIFRTDLVKNGKRIRLLEVRGREPYNIAVPLPYEISVTPSKIRKYWNWMNDSLELLID